MTWNLFPCPILFFNIWTLEDETFQPIGGVLTAALAGLMVRKKRKARDCETHSFQFLRGENTRSRMELGGLASPIRGCDVRGTPISSPLEPAPL